MTDSSNPIETTSATIRLHLLLRRVYAVNGSNKALVAWAEVLGLSLDDHASLMRGVAEVIDLLAAAETEMKALKPKLRDQLMRSLPSLREFLRYPNMAVRWADIVSSIDPLLLPFLETATEYVEPDQPHPLKQQTIEKLQRRISDLIDNVAQDDTLDPALKQALIDVLAQLLIVLSRHLVHGPMGMTRALPEVEWVLQKHATVLASNATVPAVQQTMHETGVVGRLTRWANENQGVLTFFFGIVQTALAIKSGTPVVMIQPAPPLKLLGPGTEMTPV